ncbi:MAG: UvrD-helicase domain-containing protein [Bacteroidales bacterium]|jgi:ATP-dependent exoDNAse (exonuclease V) beta subunit
MPFTVYKSSAGSGKTFTLVKEYITLAIQKPEYFRHILAITFTNKAANEMKDRTLRYLTELSFFPFDKNSAAYKFLLPDLLKITSLNEKEIAEKSRQVLNSILHNYSDFAIGTIDSFVHRIIRSFAHDLKIPMNFEVEMDMGKLLSNAIDLLLNKAGSDELLTKILVEFAEAKTDDEKSWHIEKDLHDFAQQLFKEDNYLHLEKIRNLSINDFLEIRKKLETLISKFEKDITTIASKTYAQITKYNIPTDSFYRGNSGIGKYFENLSNGLIGKINPNSYVAETVEQDKWYAGKATTSEKSNIDKIKEELGNAFLKIRQIKEKQYKQYVIYKLLFANIYPVAVLNEIESIIDEIKKEDNILTISEFNSRILKIVVSQPVPFIYERIGEKYQNYLIDEFQDTSTLQWMNLLPLIENSLSYDHFNMIVGDGKQAIYRWRGGDVEQFAFLPDLPKGISDTFSKERAAAIKRSYEEKNLSSNYRSKAEIIDFNNKFFSYISSTSSDYIKFIYKQCEQTYNPENKGGYIQIDFIDKNDFEDITYDEITLDKITEIIDELQEQNFLFRDIAILCRSNKNASVIARHLISSGIKIVSEESLLLATSPEISFLLACASFIANTNEDLSKYRILHYLISKSLVLDNDIFALCKVLRRASSGKDNSINTNLFCEYLHKNNFIINLSLLASLPVYEVFEELIAIFGINKITDSYIQFFLDAVLEFSAKKKNNIPEFLNWWEEQKNKRSIIVPDGIDAIRIMTIHKSKGLEFPVVIYPYATERVRNTKNNLWIDTDIPEIPELQSSLVNNNEQLGETEFEEFYLLEKNKSFLDMLNILYVVMTRPSERLYILSKKPSDNFSEPKSIPDLFASFLQSQDKWDENKGLYTTGEKLSYIREKDDATKTVSLHPYRSRKDGQLVHLRKKSSDVWDVENPLRNSEWGNLVHFILSLIDNIENTEKVIYQLVQDGIIEKEQENELTVEIKNILSLPEIAEYFQKDSVFKSEAEILLNDGTVIRPDRVVLKGNKAVILDYKTSSHISDTHKQQIKQYAEAMERMGYSETEQILVYVDLNKAVLLK